MDLRQAMLLHILPTGLPLRPGPHQHQGHPGLRQPFEGPDQVRHLLTGSKAPHIKDHLGGIDAQGLLDRPGASPPGPALLKKIIVIHRVGHQKNLVFRDAM